MDKEKEKAIKEGLLQIMRNSFFGNYNPYSPTETTKISHKPSIIGFHYKPTDNSWAVNVKNGCEAYVTGKVFEIMSDPYPKCVTEVTDTKSLYEFIQIRSPRTGNEYEVLFKESDIIED